MPRSNKKSAAAKVNAAPAVVSPTKSMKKGKREAEEIVEKQVASVKKQKVVIGGVAQAIENKKVETITQKKSEEEVEPHKSVDAASNGVDADKKQEEPIHESKSDEVEAKPAEKAAPAAAAVVNGSAASEEDSADDSESEEETEEEVKAAPAEIPAAAVATLPTTAEPAAEVEEESSEDASSDEEEPAEEKPAEPQAVEITAAAEAENDSGSEESEEGDDESSEEDDEPKSSEKTTDVEMVDAPSAKKAPQTPATPRASGFKTLFMGNLSFSVEEDDVKSFFSSVAEVVDVRLAMKEGRFAGYGHVDFATPEAAQEALKLNGEDLIGRPVRLDPAKEKGSAGGAGNEIYVGRQGRPLTVFVRGFDGDADFDSLKSTLEGYFKQCGEITRCYIPKDPETGGPKRHAFLDFAELTGFYKALLLNGSDIGGHQINVEESRDPDVCSACVCGGRGRFGGGGGGRSGGGRSGGGRRRGGGGRGRGKR